ncbi:MAG: phosphoribosylformylglycinamidine synthase, partial [Eubacterium callanderi]
MIKRIFVEKKAGFNTEAQELAQTFQRILGIKGLSSIRIIYRYDVEGLEGELLENVKRTIFSEPNVDNIYEDTMA